MCMYMYIRNNETETDSSDKIMPMLATTSRSGRGTVTIYRQRVSLIDTLFLFFSKATIRRNGGQDNT